MKIDGLVAAPFAAYYEDGSVNLEIIPGIVNRLVCEGVSGVFICGTNGEGLSMTIEERKLIAEAYVKAAQKRIITIVHVGHSSIAESRTLVKHAYAIGADAFSSVAAFYFKPSSVLNLANCMAEIASAAPSLPFYYYHMPAITGVNMDMVEFLKQGNDLIPNLAGIKYTASTLHELQACIDAGGDKYQILSGYDEILLSALVVGATGAIGSTYTFAAPIYLAIIRLFKENNLEEAKALQLKAVDFIRCLTKYPAIPAQRAIMKMLGTDLGNPRLPLTDLTITDYENLRADLEKVGFFYLQEKYAKNLNLQFKA